MNLPNLADARIRSNKKTEIIRGETIVPDDMKDFGSGKKYYILKIID